MGLENLNKAKEMSPIGAYGLATWHQNLFCGIISAPKPLISMTSQSKDGEIAARSAERLGIICTRGSSSKGGQSAMHEMIKLIKELKHPAALTVDGPRGPARVPKKGILKIAHECQMPIIPYCSIASNHKVFEKAWDNFRLPKLFGTIYTVYGEPFMVEEIDDENLEKYSQMIIKSQNEMEEQILSMI